MSSSLRLCRLVLLLVGLASAVAQQVILPAASSIYPSIWPQPFSLTLNSSLANGGPTLYVDPDNFAVTWDANCADRNPLLTQSQTIQKRLFPISAQPQQDTSLSVGHGA
jgi:hypothetical protein